MCTIISTVKPLLSMQHGTMSVTEKMPVTEKYAYCVLPCTIKSKKETLSILAEARSSAWLCHWVQTMYTLHVVACWIHESRTADRHIQLTRNRKLILCGRSSLVLPGLFQRTASDKKLGGAWERGYGRRCPILCLRILRVCYYEMLEFDWSMHRL